MLTLEKIKKYMEPKTRFTDSIRAEITDTARLYNIKLPDCRCRNKWFDVLMLIYKKMKVMDSQDEFGRPKTNDKYTYLRVNPIVINGKRYDQYTDNEDIERLRLREPIFFKTIYKINK